MNNQFKKILKFNLINHFEVPGVIAVVMMIVWTASYRSVINHYKKAQNCGAKNYILLILNKI